MTFTNFFFIRLFLFFLLLSLSIGFSIGTFYPEVSIFKVLNHFFAIFYSPICHQSPERCIVINDIALLICARCSGIFFGALIISLLSLFYWKKRNPPVKYIFISFFPLLLDVFLVMLGLYNYSKTISFITGLVFGSTIFLYILHTIENNLLVRRNEF